MMKTESENEEGGETTEIYTKGASELLQNASILNAFESRFNQLKGTNSGYIASLPASIRKRLDALKNLSKKNSSIERELQKEIHELEKKFFLQHKPIYEKRQEIINGVYEPTEEESTLTEADLENEDVLPSPPAEGDVPTKGIPEFWLTCLKNLPPLQDVITPEDDGALKHLVDIKYEYLEGNPGFRLDFVFEENEYFTNTVLSKSYFLSESPDSSEMVYDHAEGTTIDWKEGKDLSVRIEIKKQRHKATNKTRTVKKTVPAETFFHFFKALEIPENSEEVDDEMIQAFEIDYETGEMIKEKLVPDAIHWFTGKALEEFEDDEDEYDDDEDEYGDEDDDEDDDEDENDAAAAKPECKQQ